MTALAADRTTQWKEVGLKAYPVAASTLIYADSLVCLNASGYAVPAADAASYTTVGMADGRVDNSSGANGDLWVRVRSPVIAKFAAVSITQAMVGRTMYVVDDQTFDDAVGTNGIAAGVLLDYESATSGWILVAPTVNVLLSGLTASVAELNILDGATLAVAELNLLDGSIAGTSVASKVLTLGADKNTDVLALPVGGLAIGPGAGTPITASAAEINTLTGITPTAAELNKVDGIPATAYLTVTEEVTFTQTSGNGTYTGTIALPAGSRIIDIGVDGQVLWNASVSASLIVGDGVDPDGFFTATDLVATDLLAGEINNLEHPGGKAGAYIAAEQRVLYQATARSVIGVLTQVGTGTAGRTRMYVTYATPTAVAATKV